MSTELQAIKHWYQLCGRVMAALAVPSLTIAMYHGTMKGWQFFWACFNAWIARRNYNDGMRMVREDGAWQLIAMTLFWSAIGTGAAILEVWALLY